MWGKALGLLGIFCTWALQAEFNFLIQEPQHHAATQTACLFSHGLANTYEQGLQVFLRSQKDKHQRWIIDSPLVVFDFPDAKHKGAYYHKQVNLGQEKDLERLDCAYKRVTEELPDHNIIMAGISRGAAATLNYAALYEIPRVRALLAESPFDRVSSVIKHLLTRYHLNWVPFSKSIGFKVCEKHFPNIDLKGFFPIDIIEKIPTNVPVMLVHSKKDRVVPINSSRRLYIKLRETGHTETYLVELQSGNHGRLIFGPDADFYCYVAHAFFRRYDLAHNPEFAQHGQHLLKLCQPSVADVLHRMKQKRSIDEEEIDETELEVLIEDEKDTGPCA